jgi:hypothetical protein
MQSSEYTEKKPAAKGLTAFSSFSGESEFQTN